MRGSPRVLIALALPLIVLLAFAATALATGGGGKEDVCHWANHKYVEISVSVNAVPAHLAHGDVMTDDYGACPSGG